VCHIASGDRWAGAEAQLAILVRQLALDPSIELNAIILNQGRLANELAEAGIPIRVIPESERSFLAIFSEASKFLKSTQTQIIHSHRYKENLAAAMLAQCCGIDYVVRTQHGLPEPFTGLRRFRQYALQRLDRVVAQVATDRVISVTAEMKSRLSHYISPSKIVVIHNGINIANIGAPLTKEQAKHSLGIAASVPVIGTVGRLERIKRLDIFVAAAQHIRKKVPDSMFIIAGEGEQKKILQDQLYRARLQDAILLLGYREDVIKVLSAMDVFVLCSDHEGLPIALLEALALRIPVVARKVGGIPEVIEDAISGILIESARPEELAAGCIKAIFDTMLRTSLTAGSRAAIQRFTVQSTAAQVVALYKSLVASEPSHDQHS